MILVRRPFLLTLLLSTLNVAELCCGCNVLRTNTRAHSRASLSLISQLNCFATSTHIRLEVSLAAPSVSHSFSTSPWKSADLADAPRCLSCCPRRSPPGSRCRAAGSPGATIYRPAALSLSSTAIAYGEAERKRRRMTVAGGARTGRRTPLARGLSLIPRLLLW